MDKVEIIMATYNGAKYISQQILSIIGQNYEEWVLLIHDDGSDDGTIDIIKHFIKIDSRIRLIEDHLSFRSPALNFLHLLKFSSANKICFCDQDDIWFENKLFELVRSFPNVKKPCALFSSGYLYNSNTNRVYGKLDYKVSNLRELLFINGGIHGSRSMINGEMRDCMLAYNGSVNMHDHLMSLIACSFGEIKYINTPLFLYRQHSNNVTGNIIKSPIKRILKGFTGLNDKYVVSSDIYETIKNFYSTYENLLSDKDKLIINDYLEMIYNSQLFRIKKIISRGFSIGKNGKSHLILKMLSRNYFNN